MNAVYALLIFAAFIGCLILFAGIVPLQLAAFVAALAGWTWILWLEEGVLGLLMLVAITPLCRLAFNGGPSTRAGR